MFLVLPLCLRPAEETLTLFDSQARRQEKMEQELQKNAALTGVLGTPAALATNDASSTAQGNRAEIRVDISSPREGQPSQSQSPQSSDNLLSPISTVSAVSGVASPSSADESDSLASPSANSSSSSPSGAD